MKISLHRALSQLKLIDAKVVKMLTEIEPNGIRQKGKLVDGYKKEEEFNAKAQSKFQSINDLIERKVRLKSAIVAANAVTMVKIGEKEMTIADAITYKQVLEQKKSLLATLRSKYAQKVRELEGNNKIVEVNLQKVLEATFGKDNVKISKEDMDSVRKPFLESNEWHLVDPLQVEKRIEELEKEIDEFESEVDAVLSEANALSTIEIDD